MFDLKSKHAFGSEADIDIALEQGLIDAYDILYLDEKKIGWIDRDGNKVIIDNSVPAEIGESIDKNAGDISELKEHASTAGEEISGLKEQMSTATENISDMNDKISSVEEDIVKLNEDMQNAGAVASVNGQTGEVELSYDDLKDKPFYEGDPVEVEFVPLADYLPYDVDEAGIFINLSENKELIEGDDYIVNVNGQTYRYTAKRFILDEFGIDWIYIGCNLAADGPQFSADSPFYIHIIEEEGVKYINCGLAVEFFPDVTSETPVQIGITHIERYIKKIDEKFIPNTISVSWENVEDKPFYAEVVEENVIPLGEYQFISRNLPPDYFEPEIALSIPDFQLEDGLVYGVTIQGKTYVCPAGYNSSYDVIVWPYGVDDNPPLTIRNRIDGGCTVKLAYAEFPDFIASGEETIEVPIQFGMTIVTENVTMLDKKYIPSNVLIIELKSVPDNAQGFPPDAFTTIEQAVSEGKLVYAVNAMGNTCYEFKGWDYLDDGTRYADFVQARVYLPSMNISYKQLRLTEGDEDNLVSARGYHGAIPPAVTTSDNGSILQVVDGVWTAQPLSTSEHTWASLPDKPFGETVQIPHTLNVESMDGLESFTTTHTYEGVDEEVTFYKVADIVPEPSAIDWTNSYYGVDMSQEGTDCWYTYPDGTPALIVARATEISAVPYSNNEAFSVPSAGIWTSAADYVNGLVCTVEEVTKLSDEFIPDTIARVSDIPEVPEHTWESLPDRPFGEEKIPFVIECTATDNHENNVSDVNGYGYTVLFVTDEILHGDETTVSVEKDGVALTPSEDKAEGEAMTGANVTGTFAYNYSGPTYGLVFMFSVSAPETVSIGEWSSFEITVPGTYIFAGNQATAYIGNYRISGNTAETITLDPKYLPMDSIIEVVKQSFTDVSQEGA